jgi:hypothetical protein
MKRPALPEYVNEYKKQLKKGVIRKAYKGLMEYISGLKVYLTAEHPDYVFGSIYPGYMDMTYFPLSTETLKRRKLKIAIVFIHDAARFEVWLAAQNKQIQTQYWKLFKESGWNKYRVVSTTKGVDSIIEYTLADNPDFNDLGSLTEQIETGTLDFINAIEDFLLKMKNGLI